MQPSWTSKERRPLTIINMNLLRFSVLGKKATVIIISLELPSHHITHRHPIFWISQTILTGITMRKSACHISKPNRIVVNPFSLFSHFSRTGRMQPKRISKEPIPSSSCQRGSSSSVHLVLLWYLCFC